MQIYFYIKKVNLTFQFPLPMLNHNFYIKTLIFLCFPWPVPIRSGILLHYGVVYDAGATFCHHNLKNSNNFSFLYFHEMCQPTWIWTRLKSESYNGTPKKGKLHCAPWARLTLGTGSRPTLGQVHPGPGTPWAQAHPRPSTPWAHRPTLGISPPWA